MKNPKIVVTDNKAYYNLMNSAYEYVVQSKKVHKANYVHVDLSQISDKFWDK